MKNTLIPPTSKTLIIMAALVAALCTPVAACVIHHDATYRYVHHDAEYRTEMDEEGNEYIVEVAAPWDEELEESPPYDEYVEDENC